MKKRRRQRLREMKGSGPIRNSWTPKAEESSWSTIGSGKSGGLYRLDATEDVLSDEVCFVFEEREDLLKKLFIGKLW